MQKYIVSNRTDANCARFYNMTLAFYVARRFGVKFLFDWGKVDVGVENDDVYKEYQGQRMIGCKVDAKECYFDKIFLEEHYIDLKAQDEDKVWNFHKPYPAPFKNLNDFKDFFQKSDYVYYDLSDANTIDQYAFIEFHPQCVWFFEWFKFSPKINTLIEKAKETALSFENRFVAFHLRCGELYPYSISNQYPHLNTYFSNIHFTIHFIEQISSKYNVIVFSDDVDTVNLMIEKLRGGGINNVFSVDTLRKFDDYSVGELLMFDLALMSMAIEVYGSGNSSVSNLASLINSAATNLRSIYHLANSKEHYYSIKDKVKKYEFNPYHQSFSYLHLFLLAEKFKLDIKEQKKYLQKAIDLYPQNYKYKLYLAFYLARYEKTRNLENFLASIDFEYFVNLLALSLEKTQGSRRFYFPYFCLASDKYPHIKSAFIRLENVDKKNNGLYKRKIRKIWFKKYCCAILPFLKRTIIHP